MHEANSCHNGIMIWICSHVALRKNQLHNVIFSTIGVQMVKQRRGGYRTSHDVKLNDPNERSLRSFTSSIIEGNQYETRYMRYLKIRLCHHLQLIKLFLNIVERGFSIAYKDEKYHNEYPYYSCLQDIMSSYRYDFHDISVMFECSLFYFIFIDITNLHYTDIAAMDISMIEQHTLIV